MAISRFQSLAEDFELLQSQLKNGTGSGAPFDSMRRDLLRRMRQTLNAMHEEHRAWLESLSAAGRNTVDQLAEPRDKDGRNVRVVVDRSSHLQMRFGVTTRP